MIPVKPRQRMGWRQVTYAKNQPHYHPLPANVNDNSVETCWRLNWRERIVLLVSGRLYLRLLTFGKPLQPIRMSVLREEMNE